MSNEEPPTSYTPEPQDVLLGRAASVFHHPGNRRYRHIVGLYLRKYANATDRLEKMILIKQVTEMIIDDGRVRFLKSTQGRGWKEVSFREAQDKVSHALRDGNKKGGVAAAFASPPPPVNVNPPIIPQQQQQQHDLLLERRRRQQQQQQQLLQQQQNNEALLLQQQLNLLNAADPRSLSGFAHPLDFTLQNERMQQATEAARIPPPILAQQQYREAVAAAAAQAPRVATNIRVPIQHRPKKDFGLSPYELLRMQSPPISVEPLSSRQKIVDEALLKYYTSSIPFRNNTTELASDPRVEEVKSDSSSEEST